MTDSFTHHSQWPHALPQEVAVAIEVNGVSYAVMMASPFDLDDFAIGFLFTERVIKSLIDVHDIELVCVDKGILVQVEVANRCALSLKQKRRFLKGTSGCGLCGVVALEHAFEQLPRIVTSSRVFENGLPMDLKKRCSRQQLQRKVKTGQDSEALHAAFWLNATGEISVCREDIGRHNAVDKLIGSLIKQAGNVNFAQGALVVTSRCSVELVHKAIVTQIGTLISFASPSTLAVALARTHNVQLIHVPKSDKPVLYASTHCVASEVSL